MLRTTRRVLTGPLLVAAIGAGMFAVPGAAQAAGSSATIRVSGTLKVRSAPSLAARIVGSLADAARVQIDCVLQGEQVRGSVRTSPVWDKLTGGGYVPDAYVLASGELPRCSPLAPEAVPVKAKPVQTSTGPISGRVRSDAGSVNVRVGPAKTAAVLGTLTQGSQVPLVCGVWGDSVVGTVRTTRQWDRTVTGRYISHAYVISAPLHLCPDAKPLPDPDPGRTLTPAEFIATAVPGAQRGWREFGVPPSVTIAQAILESGWGRSKLAAADRNYFGIKCFDGRFGSIASGCHEYPTTECTKAGACFTTTATFRTYATATDSFRDHGNFLRVNNRYQPAFAYTKDANRFIWQVWKAGYATDPNYYTKVTGLMAAYGLYQYDTWK